MLTDFSAIRFRGDLLPGDMTYDGDLVPCLTQGSELRQISQDVDFLCGANFGEVEVFGDNSDQRRYFAHYQEDGSLGMDGKADISNVADFYAYYRKLLGDLYDRYDFEDLIQVTDENCWRTARRLAAARTLRTGQKGAISQPDDASHVRHVHGESVIRAARSYSYIWSHIMPVRPEDISPGP